MAASFLRIFYSDSPSNDIHFTHEDLDAPPPSPLTPPIHSPYSQSRSSSPTRMQYTTPISPEHCTISCTVPNDEILSESEVPEASSIKPNSKSGKPELSKARDYNFTPSQNVHQSSIRHFSPTLVLQNTGSVARDHLASERTFLAYVRTSLGLASAGVALIQLFTMSDLASKANGVPLPAVNQRLQKFATPLGLLALGLSLIVLLIGE